MTSDSTLRHASERAFTLLELMTVVAIVGVLATLGLVAYRKFIASAKSSEAIYMVGAIRAAEESYRAETLTYLNVTAAFDKFYPHAATVPGNMKLAWDAPTHPDYAAWRQLGARPDGPVYYGYKVAAGLAGAVPPALDIAASPTWPGTRDFYESRTRQTRKNEREIIVCVHSRSFKIVVLL